MAHAKNYKFYEAQKAKKAEAAKKAKWVEPVAVVEEKLDDVLLGEYHGLSVYIEEHQGKHCEGHYWPGYRAVGKQGPNFLASMVRYGNTPLFHLLCGSQAFRDEVTPKKANGQNGLLFFDFKKIVCGADDETSCQLQWKRDGKRVMIHGCPDPKGKELGTFLDIKSLK